MLYIRQILLVNLLNGADSNRSIINYNGFNALSIWKAIQPLLMMVNGKTGRILLLHLLKT